MAFVVLKIEESVKEQIAVLVVNYGISNAIALEIP